MKTQAEREREYLERREEYRIARDAAWASAIHHYRAGRMVQARAAASLYDELSQALHALRLSVE